MPDRSKEAGSGFIAGRFGEFPARWGQGLSDQFTRIARSPFGPSEEEVRANLAGEASADAALALHDAELAEAGGGQADSEAPLDLTAAAFFDVDNTMV
ncbi:HAD-IB family hydrolase, partial [Nocardia gipuzkoensis]